MSSPSEKPIDLGSNDEPSVIAHQLKMLLHSTRKGDRETIDSYLKNLKSIADSLAANGDPVSDPDLVLQLLAGLPSPQYSPYVRRISSQYPLPEFSEACSLLYIYESENPTNSNNDDQIRRAELQMQFHSTRREDFQTVEAYVGKLKSIANSLPEMDSQISDSVMVLQLLAGLPHQYKPFKKTITSSCPLPNFGEACSLLYMQEGILLQEKITSDPEKSSALLTKEKFYTVMDTLDTVITVVGKVSTVCAAAGAMGAAVGIVGTVSTVSTVASIACQFWNVLGPWSGGSSSATPSKSTPKSKPNTQGNKKSGPTGESGNNNSGRGGGGPSTRYSGIKQE